jgi:hypothetical protein
VIGLYLPQLRDFVGLAVTWGVALLLACAGSGIAGRRQAVEIRLLAGWGALCVLLTLWGVLAPASLRWPAIAFAVAAVATQLTQRSRLQGKDWRALARLLLLTLPLWLVMAPIRPSQPDSFLNLLPNAMYLVDYGRLPSASLPPSHSFLPAAPYNFQFLAFLGALADPDYPAGGMPLLNVMLQLAGGLAIARSLAAAAPENRAAPSWSLTALGFLLATLANPGFVPRIDFSPYTETALTVTAMFAGWLFVLNQGELAAGRPPGRLLPLGLVLAALVNAKQSGLGLVAALAGAAAAAGWGERAVARAALLRAIAIAVLPPVLLFALWRYYATHAGVAELKALPWGEWNWATMPETLRSIGRVIAEKPIYFGCVALAVASLPPLLRRRGWTPTTRLLAFQAAAFALYNLYLMLAYLAHFPGEMGREAHSYFRYNTHLALLLVLSLALALRDVLAETGLVGRFRRPAAAAIIALALLTPLGFGYRLRFDLVMPQPLVWDLAQQAKPYLRDGDRLALLLPGDNDSVAEMLAGVLLDVPPRRRGRTLLVRPTADEATLAEAARLGFPLALISCTVDGTAALLEYNDGGWRQRAVFPYPADARRWRWQRFLAWPPLCRPS